MVNKPLRIIFSDEDPSYTGKRTDRITQVNVRSKDIRTPVLVIGAQSVGPVKVQSKRIDPNDLDKLIEEFERRASYQLAKESLRVLTEWLRPGGTMHIGWRGTTVKSLHVSKSPLRSSRGLMHYVYTDETAADYYVRHGVEPGLNDMAHVSWEERKQWVRDRGLKYLRKEPPPFGMSEEDVIVQDVWNSIYEHGAAHFWDKQEWATQRGDRTYFNYPQWFNDKARPNLDSKAEDIMNGLTRSMIEGQVETIIIGSLSSALTDWAQSDRWNTGYDVVGRHYAKSRLAKQRK